MTSTRKPALLYSIGSISCAAAFEPRRGGVHLFQKVDVTTLPEFSVESQHVGPSKVQCIGSADQGQNALLHSRII